MKGILAQRVQGSPVLYDTRVKGFNKRDAVQNVWEEIAENLDFVDSGNFVRGSTEAVARLLTARQVPMAGPYY